MNSLILIGMPTCGKSTLGRALAEHYSLNFIDSDRLIEQQQGCSLQQIADTQGYQALREIEAECLLSLSLNNTVLATGGSAVYNDCAMAHLKAQGPIVYLTISLNTLKARLHNARTRGLAKPPTQSLEALYQERVPLYARYADRVVDNNGEYSLQSLIEHIDWLN